MAEAKITVSILSWLLEDRLIKTLIQIPRTTSMPLNLCLHVQGAEQLSRPKRQEILDATSGFMIRDVFFTKGNLGAAKPRAELIKRSAKTPFIFMTDNDMIFQEGSLDKLLEFLKLNPDYGMIDLAHNYLKWHRRVHSDWIECIPVNYDEPNIVDVDLIGAASIMMRQEVALIPDLIDASYHIGTWDFDMCLNVKCEGWKIATLCDKQFIAINDKTYRDTRYLAGKVRNKVRLRGLELFEQKWNFSSEYYPESPKEVNLNFKTSNDTFVISRAIYNRLGDTPDIGILDEERINLMQKFFLNSLKSQTDLDFTLYLIVGSPENETVKRIKSLDYGDLNVEFIYTTGDLSEWKKSVKKSGNWGREIDSGCPEDLARRCNHPTASIMARLDIDDWVAPGWIAHMKHCCETIDQTHFLLNYQVFGQAPDGRLYRFFAPHNPGRTSPFISLIQKEEPRISPYEDLHLKMGKKFAHVYTIPPSYAFMVVHGGNRSNRIYPLDAFIGNFTAKVKQTKVEKVTPMIKRTISAKNDWRSRMKDNLKIKISGN